MHFNVKDFNFTKKEKKKKRAIEEDRAFFAKCLMSFEVLSNHVALQYPRTNTV
jgi:hypothetical protein